MLSVFILSLVAYLSFMTMGQKNFVGEKEAFFKENLSLVEEALGFLNPRNQKIVVLFFGLEEKNQTLAGIGKKIGITRERVRQIKAESLKKVRKIISSRKDSAWMDFFEKMEQLFLSQGGFIEEKRLGALLKRDISAKEQGVINFLLSLAGDKFSFEKKNSRTKNFWVLKNKKKGVLMDRKKIFEAVDFLIDFFKKEKKPFKKAEIKKQLAIFSEEFFLKELGEKRTENLLFLGTNLKCNLLGQWGFSNWPAIATSITKEKAHLILKKKGQPLHFRKIANLIKEYWPEKKIILQTVHNELIKDSRFALVGRGVYGLCEWGFIKSSVKKILWDFLKKADRPLDKKEILEYIMKIKKVNVATISVCLADRRRFQKTDQEKYIALEEK